MSVVGIDIGYQSCYVSIARHGGVETIANEYSERASPSIVGFTSTLRTMGTTAKTQMTTNLKNSIPGFTALLGRPFSDEIAQEEFKNQHYNVEQLPGDQIGIKVQYLNEEQTFSPTQAAAVMLGYLKGVASKALAKPVTDCVISVPSYYMDAQRRALLDSASIAGLNCLRLLNQSTAVALAYGIYKQDLPEEKEKSRNVVFVDVGHHCLQVTVCAFNKGKLKVLCKVFDPRLGGRDFDRRLVEHFANEFKGKYKVDTFSKSRAVIRLTNECEKLKKLMSANSTPIPLNIECFMEDKDVTGRFDRAQFEELCSDLLLRIKNLLQSALNKSGLKSEEIHSVEVVGGCTRIPAVKNAISSVFNREISTTLNLDEAVARGCALQCAILSPTFKVRDFSIHDTQPYPIQLTWKNNGEPGQMMIFDEGDQIYHSKMLTFFRKNDFELQASYPGKIPFGKQAIGSFIIKGVKPTEEGESSKVKIKIRLSIHGTLMIKSAVMVEKQEEVVEEVMETDSTTADNKKDTSDTKDSTDSPPLEQMDTSGPTDPQPQPQTNPESGTQTGGTQPNPEPTTNSTEPEVKPEPDSKTTPPDSQATPPEATGTKQPSPKKVKKKYKQIDLPVTENTNALTKKYLDEAFERECKMAQQDKLEVEKADAKNSVEEYVYDMRDKICTSLEQFINETDKEKFQSLLDATEEWLYDEGEDQPKKVYVERLKELKSHGDPVIEREKETNLRPGAFDLLGRTIVHYRKITSAYEEGDEKYNHLSKEDITKVNEAIEVKQTWLNSSMQQCGATPLHSDPPIKFTQIQAAIKELNSLCNPIVTKPKPKVEPPKDDAAAGDKTENGEKKEENDEKKEENDEKKEEKMEEGNEKDTINGEKSTKETPVVEDMDVD